MDDLPISYQCLTLAWLAYPTTVADGVPVHQLAIAKASCMLYHDRVMITNRYFPFHWTSVHAASKLTNVLELMKLEVD